MNKYYIPVMYKVAIKKSIFGDDCMDGKNVRQCQKL